MRADLMASTAPFRCLIVGWPGSGKTGSLASLVNAGLKMRVLSFDNVGNMQPLLQYVEPERLQDLDIQLFEDPLGASGGGAGTMEVVGQPRAFRDALKAMDHWTYSNPDGTVVDLGRSSEWGPDTVVVLDNITSMGRAAKRRGMSLGNRTSLNMRDTDWGVGMGEQEAFIEKLVSSRNHFHLIVLSHLKLIGPKEVRKGDDDITKDVKEQQAELIDTRYYPSALGRALPPVIGGHFPTLILAETEYASGTKKAKRFLRTEPRPELDLKLPARLDKLGEGTLDKLPISDGLLTIFNATTPGVEACLAEAKRAKAKDEATTIDATAPAGQKENETWQKPPRTQAPLRRPPLKR